jgi:hypothetical protein
MFTAKYFNCKVDPSINKRLEELSKKLGENKTTVFTRLVEFGYDLFNCIENNQKADRDVERFIEWMRFQAAVEKEKEGEEKK